MKGLVTANINQLLATADPAELGPGRRPGAQSLVALDARLDACFREIKLPPAKQQLIRALVLLWHDHLDAAHTISQDIENADGSFIHAIMHRREPDYGNAKYWLRHVGQHRAFPEIAERVGKLLKERGAGDMAKRILPGGQWDAFAFVDACEEAEHKKSADKDLLREIQRIEFEVLLERFVAS